ncbi:MAG: alpha/beta fold hydrolase [Bacteroidetes bacterium]|nr:alpha/beta fold hydrolase [Bacteroidota bacterium]
MKLHYRILGEGVPILILHGLFGMSDNWQSFARSLADNGFKVILPDLRNHGHSPHDPFHSYPLMAQDIAGLIKENHLHSPVVLGHSMGGKVCLQLLNDHPGLIQKGIVVDIAPWRYPIHHREILDALLAVHILHIHSRKEAETVLDDAIHDSGIKQFLLKNLYRKGDNHFAWRFNLNIIKEQIEEVGEPTWPRDQISTPVLFIKGEKSGYIDPFRMNEILQWYPNAELVNIPNAGHWVHAEQPQLLLEEVLHFLK